MVSYHIMYTKSLINGSQLSSVWVECGDIGKYMGNMLDAWFLTVSQGVALADLLGMMTTEATRITDQPL